MFQMLHQIPQQVIQTQHQIQQVLMEQLEDIYSIVLKLEEI